MTPNTWEIDFPTALAAVRAGPRMASFRRLLRVLDRVPLDEASRLAESADRALASWPVHLRSVQLDGMALGAAQAKCVRHVEVDIARCSPADLEGSAIRESIEGLTLGYWWSESDAWLDALAQADGMQPRMLHLNCRSSPERLRALFESPFFARVQALGLLDAGPNVHNRAVAAAFFDFHETGCRKLPLTSLSVPASFFSPARLSTLPAIGELEELHLGRGACSSDELRVLMARAPRLRRLTFENLTDVDNLAALFRAMPRSLEAIAIETRWPVTPEALAALSELPNLAHFGAFLLYEDLPAILAALPRLRSMALQLYSPKTASKRKASALRAINALRRASETNLGELSLSFAGHGEQISVLTAIATVEGPKHVTGLKYVHSAGKTMTALAQHPSWLVDLIEFEAHVHAKRDDHGDVAITQALVEHAPKLAELTFGHEVVSPQLAESLLRLESRAVLAKPRIPRELLARMEQKGGAFDAVADEAERVADLWKRIDRYLSDKQPPAFAMLGPAASERDRDAWERALGRPLPSPLRALYEAHDGADARCQILSSLCQLRALRDRKVQSFFDLLELEPDVIWLPSADALRYAVAVGRSTGGRYEAIPFARLRGTDLCLAYGIEDGAIWVHDLERDALKYDFPIAKALSTWLTPIAVALESQAFSISKRGLIAPASSKAAPLPAPMLEDPALLLVRELLRRRFVELASEQDIEPLAVRLSELLRQKPSARAVREILRQLDDDPSVQEIFADERSLARVVIEFV